MERRPSVVAALPAAFAALFWAAGPAGAQCTNTTPATGETVVCTGLSTDPVEPLTSATNVTVRVEPGAAIRVEDVTGVSLFGASLLENSGTIEVEDVEGGDPAVTVLGSGNVVRNFGTGLIRSAGNNAGVEFLTSFEEANTLFNLAGGTIESPLDVGILGGFGDETVENAGSIVGGGGVAVDLGLGADTLILSTGSRIVGDLQGGGGIDLLAFEGSGTLSGSNVLGFENLIHRGPGDWTVGGGNVSLLSSDLTAFLSVEQGTLRFENNLVEVEGTVSVGGLPAAATLVAGSGATISASSVTVGQNGVVRLEGGSLTAGSHFFGAGSLLTGNGRIVGPSTFAGTIAPGASIGTVTLAGDATFTDSFVFDVELSPVPGVSDRIVVEGGSLTIQPGAALSFTLLPGDFQDGATYEIVRADGGITGSFAFTPPLLSFTQQLELAAVGPGTLVFQVAPAPGDRLIAEVPFNPVNGSPASLLPSMAADDFWSGVDELGDRPDPQVPTMSLALEYERFDVDGVDIESWSLPFRRTVPLDREGWALVLDAPITYVDVEGETAISGSVGTGLRFPVTEDWTLTPAVRVGGVWSDDFNTLSPGYGASVTSSFRFAFGGFRFELGNLIGYYRADDVGTVVDQQIEYSSQNVTFRNGLLAETELSAFGRRLDTQLFVIDTRHTVDDLFVQNYTQVGAAVRPAAGLFGLPPFRVGVTGTFGDDVSGIKLNAGYRF